MNGSIAVTSDHRMRGSTFLVHVLLRTHSGSPLQQREAATTVLEGKRVLVLAASEANRDTFAKLLPSVSATVSCVAVARGITELPATVTADLLENSDILIAELTLVTALQEALSTKRRTTKEHRTVIVPLTTSLEYELRMLMLKLSAM